MYPFLSDGGAKLSKVGKGHTMSILIILSEAIKTSLPFTFQFNIHEECLGSSFPFFSGDFGDLGEKGEPGIPGEGGIPGKSGKNFFMPPGFSILRVRKDCTD